MRKLASLLGLALLTPALAAGTTTVTLAPGGPSSSSSTIVLTATVVNSCTLTTGDIALGNYAATAAQALTGSTAVTVQCNNGAQYQLSGVPATLALSKDGSTVPLTADLSHDFAGGTATSTGGLDSYTVGASLAPGQYSVPADDGYTGTVNVQIDLLN